MRKYIFIFLLILSYPVYLLAAGVYGVDHPAKVFDVDAPDKVFGVEGLSSCCNTLTFVGNPGDTESFECPNAGNFCTTETTYVDGGDGIFDTYAVCMDGHCLRETRTDEHQEDNYVRWDFGATDAGFTFGFDFVMPNMPEDVSAFWLYLHEAADMATYGICFYVKDVGATADYIGVYNGTNYSDSIALTPGTTYRMIIEYVQANTCTITLKTTADVFVDDFTVTSLDKAPRYATRGHRVSSGAPLTLDTDNVRYKSGGGGF